MRNTPYASTRKAQDQWVWVCKYEVKVQWGTSDQVTRLAAPSLREK